MSNGKRPHVSMNILVKMQRRNTLAESAESALLIPSYCETVRDLHAELWGDDFSTAQFTSVSQRCRGDLSERCVKMVCKKFSAPGFAGSNLRSYMSAGKRVHLVKYAYIEGGKKSLKWLKLLRYNLLVCLISVLRNFTSKCQSSLDLDVWTI